MKKNVFIVMWCNEGLECIVPVDPDLESNYCFDLVAGNPNPEGEAKKLSQILRILKMRARANSQRHYEIYIIETVSISEDELRHLFKVSPQVIVDLIREKGKELYSDREQPGSIVIK